MQHLFTKPHFKQIRQGAPSNPPIFPAAGRSCAVPRRGGACARFSQKDFAFAPNLEQAAKTRRAALERERQKGGMVEFVISIGGVRIGVLKIEVDPAQVLPYLARLAMFGIKSEPLHETDTSDDRGK